MRILRQLPLLLAIILGCDEPTDPTTPTVAAFQVAGCLAASIGVAYTDTCFQYNFGERLLVRFCATGNCCPDSNRFSFRHRISRDTIYVTIADTAAQSCRCFCSYALLMEFNGLERSSYVFLCSREDYSSQSILYAERVVRQRS
jgi:hypothetical protein